MEIFIYCTVTQHVSGVTAPIIRRTKNCNRSRRYRSYGAATSLQRGLIGTNPYQATLGGSSCTSNMTCTGGCGYSF